MVKFLADEQIPSDTMSQLLNIHTATAPYAARDIDLQGK